jgi:hypothetical protein
MFNRMSALCLVLGAVAGYGVAGPSVTAQGGGTPLPFVVTIGETIGLKFERGTYLPEELRCSVAEAQIAWIRCASADPVQGDRVQQWYSLSRVILITRPEK